jgi:hypothetical protein
MSELPENTIEVRFGVGVVSEMPIEGVWLKVETETGTEGFVSLANLVALLNPPKPEKTPRLFSGVGPNWEQLCACPTFVDVEGARWLVSARDDYKKAPVWRDIKVYAHSPVPDKANYSLSWNTKVGYFADGDALKLMKAYRPELLIAVNTVLLKVNWPK